MREGDSTQGWCCLRLRFEERELELIRGAERLRGAALARTPRSDVLRTALSLAKAGHKIGASTAGSSVSLEETEVSLLLDALRFASQEVQWATRAQNGQSGQEAERYEAVLSAFPELVQKGVWRSFGLARELDGVAVRLQTALKG